jgi:hypothetical protein
MERERQTIEHSDCVRLNQQPRIYINEQVLFVWI